LNLSFSEQNAAMFLHNIRSLFPLFSEVTGTFIDLLV